MKSIRKSFFFKRITLLLLVALLLWTVLTSVLYAFIARPVFIRLKVEELRPKIRMIATRAAGSVINLNDDFVKTTVANSYDLFGAWTYVIDHVSSQMTASILPESLTASSDQFKNQALSMSNNLIANREELSFRSISSNTNNESYLFVAVPIRYQVTGKEPETLGAVVIVQPMAELNAGFLSMNVAVIMAALLGLLIMIVPALLATIHLIRPLDQIRRNALTMVRGDFSVRADETLAGELGELAVAMNHLSEELSATISQLRVERNQLRQIIESVAEGIIAVDRDGQVSLMNSMVWKVFGMTSDPHVAYSDPFLRMTHVDQFFQQAIASRAAVSHVLTKDHRQIFCNIAPIEDANGVVSGAVGLFRDITETERLEQTRRDYVANVSHELRTPLTAMRALLEPLNDGMVRSETDRKRYYQILLDETLRLSRLINDMLELSRLQSGHAAVQMEPFDLCQLLTSLIDRFALQADEQNIQLLAHNICTHTSSDEFAWGNPDRVEQILIILLDNAFKFTPAGGTITVALEQTPGKLIVSICDTGPGIDPEDIDHVFDRFFKADKAHNQPGTGLGLSIAREIAQQMGQSLAVLSEPGDGSCFLLTLDYADVALTADEHLKEVFDSNHDS